MNKWLNDAKPHILALGIFAVFMLLFLFPMMKGEKIRQGDIEEFIGMSNEATQHNEKTGEKTYWSNAMFGGMPHGLLVKGREYNYAHQVKKVVSLFMKGVKSQFFLGLITCYLLLICLGVNYWLSILGSLLFAFNINHIVLLSAGHNTKIAVIVVLPLILLGTLLSLRRKYLWGGVFAFFGVSWGIYMNHPQMLYYFAMLLGLFLVVYISIGVFNKTFKNWLAIPVLLLAVGLGVVSNYAQLRSTLSSSEATMRGAPILQNENREAKSSSEVKGLEWSYAMNWSNGYLDLLSLYIPNIVGGSSSEKIKVKSETGKILRQSGAKSKNGKVRAPMYWGKLPVTSGPYYLTAALIFLFVLSFFWIENKLKYAVVSAIVLGCLVSMGRNAEWLNRFLFDHLPFFNKFRSPNSLMNVLTTFFILPAFLGFQSFLNSKDLNKKKKSLMNSLLITGGIGLFFLIFSSTFNFMGVGDARYEGKQQWFLDLLIEDRKQLLKFDIARVLVLVGITFGLCYFFVLGKIKHSAALYISLIFLVLIDLIGMKNRYIDSDSYLSEQNYESLFNPRSVDLQIKNMETKGRGAYRVLDMSINTFNSAKTSYHHNTIGGYSPAKLQRIQDVIDQHISKGNQEVLNALNTKYFIVRGKQNGSLQVQINQSAYGNAWFVDSIVEVNNANEEINSLKGYHLDKVAIVNKQDFGNMKRHSGGKGSIELVQYMPNNLQYKVSAQSGGLAVFSEIWYGPNKGWEAYINGKKIDILRANYILRALDLPKGEYTLEMRFSPKMEGKKLAQFGSSLGLLVLLLALIVSISPKNIKMRTMFETDKGLEA